MFGHTSIISIQSSPKWAVSISGGMGLGYSLGFLHLHLFLQRHRLRLRTHFQRGIHSKPFHGGGRSGRGASHRSCIRRVALLQGAPCPDSGILAWGPSVTRGPSRSDWSCHLLRIDLSEAPAHAV